MKKILTDLTQGEFLQLLRKKLGKSTKEIADALNRPEYHIKRIELDREEMTITDIALLMAVAPKAELEAKIFKKIGVLLPKMHNTKKFFLPLTNGERLRIWLRRTKTETKDFAKRINYSKTMVIKWCTHRAVPLVKSRKRIATVTGDFVKKDDWGE